MDNVIKFTTDYQGRLTDDAHFDHAGDIVDRYNLSTCLLLVEAGVAEWVPSTSSGTELVEAAPVTESVEVKPRRGRPKAVTQ